MFNLRISGIIAGAAFFLSFLLSLVNRAKMPMLLIKPTLFAVLFFVFSGLAGFLVSRFLPELLEEAVPEDDSNLLPGSRIDITEGEGSQEDLQADSNQVNIGAKPDDSEDSIGDISDLLAKNRSSPVSPKDIQTGMDQSTEDDYTKAGETGSFFEPGKVLSQDIPSASSPQRSAEGRASASGKTRRAGEDAASIFDSDDMLPDLDSMAGAFASSSSGDGSEAVDFPVSTPGKKSSSAKGQAMTGDFNAKEIAAGIRTVLSKDKEG